MIPCVDLCMCVCICVCWFGPCCPCPSLALMHWHRGIRHPRRSAWHLCGPSGLGQHPGGSISSPRGRRQGGGSCSLGRHQRARVQRKTNPSALESMPTTHTYTQCQHMETTNCCSQNHLISFTVYEGFSVGAASLLNL